MLSSAFFPPSRTYGNIFFTEYNYVRELNCNIIVCYFDKVRAIK